MALTADARRTMRGKLNAAAQVVNGATMFAGGMTAIGHEDNATAANRGRLLAYNNAAGLIPAGFAHGGQVGNTTVTPIPEATVGLDGGIVTNNVVGATGVTDVGRIVYLTDDDVMQIAAPAALAFPIGVIARFNTGTSCDVLTFSFEALCSIGLSGGGRGELTALVTGVSGGGVNPAAQIVAPCHGAIVSAYGSVVEPLTGGGASLGVTAEIETVAVTGGAIVWLLADGAGSRKAASAVTATNVFHQGNLIELVLAETAASTTGLMQVHLVIEKRLGL